ncbi:MAG: nucleotidyltransferase family protein [Anaerolineae bacterium]|nr:nucleotidyltransferase family protein [Anaerolineae bacterium]
MSEKKPPIAGIITAGYTPGEDDPLADHTSGRPKAMLPVGGRSMIAYVIDALAGSRHVQEIAIVGLPEEYHASLPPFLQHVPDRGGLLANAEAGMEYAYAHMSSAGGVLISSSDLPLVTPAVVDRFIDDCLETEHDVYYSIIERSVMEARFPSSRRTYVRLKDGQFAGGDMFFVRSKPNVDKQELWERVTNARKHPLKQVRLLGGIVPLVRLVTRQMSLAEAEERASRIVGLRGRAVICADAEIGMDVDKPIQLDIARAELESNASKPRSNPPHP